MKCDEYREAINADPSESFAGGGAHAAECPSCSAYKAEVRALDARIAAALAIPVPAYEATVPAYEAPVSHSALPTWIALAAAVAIVGVFALRELAPDANHVPLAEQVLAHMDHEQASRRVTSVAVTEQRLEHVLYPQVSTMDLDSGVVSYAESCVINGNTVPHLVVQGRTGPITLILLPDEPIDAAIPLSGDNVHGVILPVGNGSVAITGQRHDQLNEIGDIGQQVVDSVTWTI